MGVYRVTPPPPKGFTRLEPRGLFPTLPDWTEPVTRENVFWSDDVKLDTLVKVVGISSGYPVLASGAEADGGPAMEYPPEGIAVSTGEGWGESIDPGTLATTAQLGGFLPLTGGTMSGAISWDENTRIYEGTSTTIDLQATYGFNFRYYTGGVLFSIDLSGVTTTGPVTLPSDPTQPLQAATKQYVDNSGPKIIQATDEADAITQSASNPNNFYFWT